MKISFSINWLKSIQPRKQRKFRKNAPLHIKGSFLHVHLAKDLRDKYKKRSLRVRVGDKVSVLRGQFKGKSGAVEKVSLNKERIFVQGVNLAKKDGAKIPYPLHPSNLLITTLVLDDKKRLKNVKERTN